VAVCSLIWGTTWLVITFQFGSVPAVWSIAYRFALAGAALAAWRLLRGNSLRLTPAQHLNALGQGLFTFALDYSLVYAAEQRVLSGAVAVVFAALALVNLITFRLALGRKASLLTWAGAVVGMIGVGFLSAGELAKTDLHGSTALGLGLAMAGVITAAIGNLFAWRQEATQANLVSATAWAMLYGSCILAAWALVTGQPIGFELTFKYVASLVYLAVFGSVTAFIIFYALARRRSYTFASYTAALTPPTAMVASAAFEGAHWGWAAVAGLLLVLGGQILLIKAPRT
jgi:drug/metabolite transporter (DMT)-like permease